MNMAYFTELIGKIRETVCYSRTRWGPHYIWKFGFGVELTSYFSKGNVESDPAKGSCRILHEGKGQSHVQIVFTSVIWGIYRECVLILFALCWRKYTKFHFWSFLLLGLTVRCNWTSCTGQWFKNCCRSLGWKI
jgi:hypothetical protein